MRLVHVVSVATALSLFACAQAAAQTSWPCPKEAPADARCYQDRDANGAYILAAIPKTWSGVLVVHAHGGPRLGPLAPKVNDEDLGRFAFFVREGHAWVNSSYRRPGFGVQMAVEDTESARQYFLEKIAPIAGKPRLVIAHGQSWGGNVAAKLAEMDAERPAAERGYAGALLTSSALPGGAAAYWHRADLRAVYQFYCNNHPRPEEAQYVVAIGLPRDVTMTAADLRARIDACTGVSKPASERTVEQARALANITGVVKIVESSLIGHMTAATHMFKDMVHERFGGNPFSNIGVTYTGSSDDAALNAGIARFASDSRAVAVMNKDGRVGGTIAMPVLTMHATRDPTVFVEVEGVYRTIAEAAGRGDKLVQVFVDEAVHSQFLTPQYVAAFNALIAWIEKSQKPTAAAIASACEAVSATYKEPCKFDVDFKPRPYQLRVPDRKP